MREIRSWFDALAVDIRGAGRAAAHRPARLAAAIGLMALAIGICTAMFAVIDALVLDPVPFSQPDELALVSLVGKHGGPTTVAPEVFQAWRESRVFREVAGAVSTSTVVQTAGSMAVRSLAAVSSNCFDLLGGVRPLRGRLLASADEVAGADTVLISEDVWRKLYRSDPSVVGKDVSLDGKRMVVVGVLPESFRFPRWDTAIWKAESFAPSSKGAALRPVAYVRFAPNVPRADVLRVATGVARGADPTSRDEFARAEPLAQVELDAYYARAIPLLSGGVVLLFLALCANLAGLVLIGLAARERELATQSALGAPRSRLIRQALLEGGLVAGAGIPLGAGIGWALAKFAGHVLPEAALAHTLKAVSVDARSLAVTGAAAALAVVISGLVPAVVGTRTDLSGSLHVRVRAGTAPSRARVMARGLLVCQVALSCVLLFGATLLSRSFVNLLTADRGFDPTDITVATVTFANTSSAGQQSRALAARSLQERARAIPGIKGAAWSYGTPPGGGVNPTAEWTSDLPGALPLKFTVNRYFVEAEFFRVYGIPILRGRTFTGWDDARSVIISQRFSRMLWSDLDPVGHRFSSGTSVFHVIGVAKEVPYPSLDRQLDAPQLYTRLDGVVSLSMLSLRCESGCPDSAAIHEELASDQPELRIVSVAPLERAYWAELARPRAAAALASPFAMTATLATAAALFVLLTQVVDRRRREFGIRAALGASPLDLRRLVSREAWIITAAGVGIGTLGALLLARALSSLLLGVSGVDPWSWAIVLLIVITTAQAASWLPARAAVRVAPAMLLKEE